MGNLTIPIIIDEGLRECRIQLAPASLTIPIESADNTFNCPIRLGFPEAPTLSEFDYDFNSPMA